MAKTERQKLKDKLEDIFAKVIKERDGYVCQRCNKPVKGQNAHCAHVYSRQGSGLLNRWDLLNALCLCFHCHIQFWHSGAGLEWFKDKFPARNDYLNSPFIDEFGNKKTRRTVTVKMSNDHLETIYENLKCKLKELKGEPK